MLVLKFIFSKMEINPKKISNHFPIILSIIRAWFSHHSRFMNHHDFAFDDTFGESANNAEVYEGTARQLVLDALEGKQGTVMMWPGYGWDVGDGMGWDGDG